MITIPLNHSDFEYVVDRLPEDLKYQITKKLTEHKYMIAGGFIRSLIAKEKVNDIDVFCTDEAAAKELADALCPIRNKQFWTENAVTFTLQGRTVQVIHRWLFANFRSLLEHFDFTIAQACVWYNHKEGKWKHACCSEYYHDVAAKRLVYTNPKEPEAGATMLRILKFVKRGYCIPMESLAQVIGALTSVEPEAIEHDLKEISRTPTLEESVIGEDE